MTYLLNVQKAIAQTEKFFAPSGGEYQGGWEQVKDDLTYAMSLGETATRQHMNLWLDPSLSFWHSATDPEGDRGYMERMKTIQLLLEKA